MNRFLLLALTAGLVFSETFNARDLGASRGLAK